MKAKLKVLYQVGDLSIKEVGMVYVELRRWTTRLYTDYVLDYGATDGIYNADDGPIYYDIKKIVINVFNDSEAIMHAVEKHNELVKEK